MTPRIYSVTAAFLLFSGLLSANELTPFRNGDSLGAVLRITDLPNEQLSKNLKNGFTTTLLYNISVKNPKFSGPEKQLVFAVYYDLWNEVFHSTELFGQVKKTTTFKTPAEVISRVEKVVFLPLEALSSLDLNAPTSIVVQVYLDPIQKDRLTAVRKWISENSINTGAEQTRTTPSNPLFSALVGEYLNAGLASLSWKTEVRSSAFRISDLRTQDEVLTH